MDEQELSRQERRYLSYVRERLRKAEYALRQDDQPIRERLERAYRDGISAIPLDWIPAAHVEAREEFAAINAALTRYGPALEGAGSVPTTVWTMSENDANDLAERILIFAARYPTP